MEKDLTAQEKHFNKWLEQFIKESGHQWGFGFYVETVEGEVFHQGTNEYKQWYDGKIEEYNKTYNS
jgi:hypothetical protein